MLSLIVMLYIHMCVSGWMLCGLVIKSLVHDHYCLYIMLMLYNVCTSTPVQSTVSYGCRVKQCTHAVYTCLCNTTKTHTVALMYTCAITQLTDSAMYRALDMIYVYIQYMYVCLCVLAHVYVDQCLPEVWPSCSASGCGRNWASDRGGQLFLQVDQCAPTVWVKKHKAKVRTSCSQAAAPSLGGMPRGGL